MVLFWFWCIKFEIWISNFRIEKNAFENPFIIMRFMDTE